MKERPIIFSAPMVRAILDGRKTQTRRVVGYGNSTVLGSRSKALWSQLVWDGIHGLHPRVDPGPDPFGCDGYQYLHVPAVNPEDKPGGPDDVARFRVRPVWDCGDRLWVRETWMEEYDTDTIRPFTPPRYLYAATHDGEQPIVMDGDGGGVTNKDGSFASAWRSPMFMPRRASRITLEITAVRVERLNQISEEDAIAEGMTYFDGRNYEADGWHPNDYRRGYWPDAVDAYRGLWDSINGKRHPWASNPWVWVLEFKRLGAT